MAIEIQPEPTPNPNAMKFTANQTIFDSDGSVSANKGDVSDFEILNQLLAIDGVANVFGYQNFITVNKTLDANWDDLLPQIEKAFATL